MTKTREHKQVAQSPTPGLDAERHQEFMRALLRDLEAFERMLSEGLFESGVRRIGAEQEMFIIDGAWQAANGVGPLMERLGDKHYTTELGQFQLEANCDPQPLAGDGLARLHAQLDDLVDRARKAAQSLDMNVVLMGILPTLRKADLTLDSMVPSPRYLALNQVVTGMRGGQFKLAIKGLDELSIEHDSVMLEACNSSFQAHLQVDPGDFARQYNLSQVLLAPLMAIAVNSPIFLGKRLWSETRVALFRQAVDTRSHVNHLRETEARVNFGTRWVKQSVTEIFQEDIARYRALVGTDLDEDPIEVLNRGGIPQMKALRLHNGTIYHWNRACFGVHEGRAHLRIENRIMPAGPSVVDQIANAAFWFGLMTEMGAREENITRRIDFDQAGANFYAAAREGLGAHFLWLDGQEVGARALILNKLLPMAEAGLHRAGVDAPDVKRYLEVLDKRVRNARTGAAWQTHSWNSLRDRSTPAERANAIVAATVRRQMTGRPVADWERARLDEAENHRHSYQRVEQYMTTDLFTVQPEDPAEIVAKLMDWERIRHVPVEDKDHRLLGLVSHRAILRLLSSGGSIQRTSVRAIMIAEPHTIAPETPTLEAIRLMRRYRVGCLPVVHEGRLVGVLNEENLVELASKLLEAQLGGGETQPSEAPAPAAPVDFDE
ncbi:CBS domain-containing protein [Myxococcota bacterium]|nr:CBS domain-containing protein [Myxococcota bacterium]